ncbi:MAG: tetratricopeptide repeat protein [Thermomicrobiales bacterium]
MTASPSGILTFLFTDVEGSTRLWEADTRAMSAALSHHDAVLTDAISTAGGSVFKTGGDAFYAVFSAAPQAIHAAAEAQRLLTIASDEAELRLKVRMAIHSGHAEARDGDFFGPPLNRVARLLSIAHGGQVVVSRAAADLAREALSAELALRDLGEYTLRDLQNPERVFQLIGPGLIAAFPPLRAPEQLLRNVPRPATPLIGREGEVAAARALLDPKRRADQRNAMDEPAPAPVSLLTLTGPGGAGKTRLALHLAADIGVSFEDGSLFVSLAEVAQPSQVPATIAATLDLGDSGGESPRELVLNRLRDRELLLVLDNFEQVMGAATFVSELIERCPRLRVIVTSRERLHLRGEHEMPLPPLSTPESSAFIPRSGADPKPLDLDRISRSEAVQLFVQRAQAVKADFAITSENAEAVAELARRLDGLPLAIELAAARSRSLPPQALLSRLERRLDLLSRGSRDLPARQQTMRDTIAWSFDLLEPAEQSLFTLISVFAGGAALAAVESIAEEAAIDTCDVFDLLESLADKSLLRLRDDGDQLRFEMLQTIREFALERLAASPTAVSIQSCHAAYFRQLAEKHEPQLAATGQKQSLDQLERDQPNIRVALAWLRDTGQIADALRLGASLWRFWWLRGDVGEGRQQLESLIAEAGAAPADVLAKALNGAGVLAESQGDWEAAVHHHERSLAIYRDRADPHGVAWSLNNLGVVAINQGDLTRARMLLEEALAVAQAAGDEAGIATALMDLGQIANHEGDRQRAAALWARSLASFRALGDESHLARSLNNLGYVAAYDGDLERARTLFTESLRYHRSVGDRQGMAGTLNNLGGIALAQGDLEAAAIFCRESQILAFESGNQLYAAIAIETLASVSRRMGEDAAAEYSFREAMRLYRGLGDIQGLCSCCRHLVEFALAAERHAEAATLLGAIFRYQTHHPELAIPDHEDAARRAREALGELEFTANWQRGQEMSVDELLALVSGEDPLLLVPG